PGPKLGALDDPVDGRQGRPQRVGEAVDALLPWFASVQFHPERLYADHPVHARLFRAFVQACGGGR
ncbi:MAG: hypothetical protein ACKPGK_11520, partial [Verrucomicrobiota bacterium]